MLIGKRYPHFACPNCRAIWNLEAEVDNPESEAEWEDAAPATNGASAEEDNVQSATTVPEHTNTDEDTQHIGAVAAALDRDGDTSMITGNLSLDEGISNDEQSATLGPGTLPKLSTTGLLSRRQASGAAPTEGSSDAVHDIELPDAARSTAAASSNPVDIARVQSPVPTGEEGPLTPRNNAGPFVFDGSAGRDGSRRSSTQPVIGSPD